MGAKNENDDEIEIDLLQLFHAVVRKLWLVIIVGLIGACAAGAYTLFLVKPMYTSMSQMIVLTKETTLSSLADLQIGSQLTNDYTVLINSRPVLEDVIDQLDLSMDYKELRNQITITNPTDTRILDIEVTMDDPQLAKKTVDALSEISSEYIADKMEVTAPKVIEEGELPTSQSSPNMTKNCAIGLLLGIIIVIVVICIKEIMNDTIQNEDDVSRYLDLPVLALVPDREDHIDKKRKNRGLKAS